MRVGVDTYSYHRLLGVRRPGETPATGRLAPGWSSVVAEGRRLGVDVLAMQTMFLGDPGALDAGALREAAGSMELALSWGGAEGLAFGTDPTASATLESWFAVAGALNTRLMRIVVGGPALRGAEPVATQVRRTAPLLRRAAASAAEWGIALCVENHGDLAVAELGELLEAAGDGRIGVCLDVANTLRTGDDPLAAARLLGPLVRMVHLRDCDDPASAPDPVAGPRVRPYGEGVVPIDGVLAELAAHEFAGPVCVELAQLGPGDDERALVQTCVAWLRDRCSDGSVGNDSGERER